MTRQLPHGVLVGFQMGHSYNEIHSYNGSEITGQVKGNDDPPEDFMGESVSGGEVLGSDLVSHRH